MYSPIFGSARPNRDSIGFIPLGFRRAGELIEVSIDGAAVRRHPWPQGIFSLARTRRRAVWKGGREEKSGGGVVGCVHRPPVRPVSRDGKSTFHRCPAKLRKPLIYGPSARSIPDLRHGPGLLCVQPPALSRSNGSRYPPYLGLRRGSPPFLYARIRFSLLFSPHLSPSKLVERSPRLSRVLVRNCYTRIKKKEKREEERT